MGRRGELMEMMALEELGAELGLWSVLVVVRRDAGELWGFRFVVVSNGPALEMSSAGVAVFFCWDLTVVQGSESR